MKCLKEKELAERWAVSQRSLQKWRQNSTGPAYLKVGRRVRYRLCDIEEWERKHRRGEFSDDDED